MPADDRQKIILLVEDEALIAMAEKLTLEENGYSVITACSGEEAVEVAHTESGIDLILMDIDLGSGMDGTSAAEMILAERDLPLVFLSSHTDPDTVEKTEGITSFGYIVKNSGDTVLLASIKMAFRLYEAQTELRRQKQHLNSALAESERIEEELTGKSEELERYFSSSLDMLCIADTEGTFLRLNPEWEKELGYPLSELEGSSFLELVHPDDRAKTVQALSRLKKQEEVLNFENRYLHSDGSYRWIEWRAKSTGSTIYATARDITERMQAETDRKESEEKFRTMISQTIDLFFLHDTEGRILEANEQAVRQLGYTREELLSMTVADLDPDYCDREDGGRFWNQIGLNQPYQFEARLKRKDGSLFPIEIVISKVAVGGRVCLMTLSRDITERRLREKVREAGELRLRAFLDLSPSLIHEFDLEGRYLMVNPATAELYQMPPSELVGKRFSDLLPPDAVSVFKERIARVQETLKPIHVDDLIQKDGRDLYFMTTLFPLLDQTGTLRSIGGIAHDITGRKQDEYKIQQLVRDKETLLKEVQHRIKNTMNTMKSLLSLQAAALGNDSPAAAALNDARSRFHSMELLYDQLYRTENHDSGSVREYLSRLVDTLVNLYPGSLDVTVQSEIDEFPLDVKSLSTLGLVVNELVTNAMKYAFGARHDGRLLVSACRVGNMIHVVVEDNGPGLPEDFSSRVPSGLGISMVHALAEQLEGSIRFEGETGTRVVLEFPVISEGEE